MRARNRIVYSGEGPQHGIAHLPGLRVGVGTMAGKAAIGQQWPNVANEVDCLVSEVLLGDRWLAEDAGDQCAGDHAMVEVLGRVSNACSHNILSLQGRNQKAIHECRASFGHCSSCSPVCSPACNSA